MPDKVSAKSFLPELADRFIKSDKVEASMHLSKLMNYDKENIREYIMEISNLVTKLKALILVHFILISFLTQYNLFQDYL